MVLWRLAGISGISESRFVNGSQIHADTAQFHLLICSQDVGSGACRLCASGLGGALFKPSTASSTQF